MQQNLNPHENLGKRIIYISWAIMVIATFMGATPPPWSIALNLGLLGYLIYKKRI